MTYAPEFEWIRCASSANADMSGATVSREESVSISGLGKRDRDFRIRNGKIYEFSSDTRGRRIEDSINVFGATDAVVEALGFMVLAQKGLNITSENFLEKIGLMFMDLEEGTLRRLDVEESF